MRYLYNVFKNDQYNKYNKINLLEIHCQIIKDLFLETKV